MCEIVVQSGIQHNVWGSLDYSLKKSDWDEKFRCGHYDGKGKFLIFFIAMKAALRLLHSRG